MHSRRTPSRSHRFPNSGGHNETEQDDGEGQEGETGHPDAGDGEGQEGEAGHPDAGDGEGQEGEAGQEVTMKRQKGNPSLRSVTRIRDPRYPGVLLRVTELKRDGSAVRSPTSRW